MKHLLPLLLWLVTGPSYAAEKSGGMPDVEQPAPPPATVGTGGEAQPTAPAKGVEEPVFQLPDLVIVGENQARIMAQKEALTGSPLQGLHEAPLLEKEESSVAALRRREPAPMPYPTRTGTGALLRAAGGTGGAFGGAGWFGRQTDRSLLGLEFHVTRALGEETVAGNAGGWEAGATLHAGFDAAGDAPSPNRLLTLVDRVLGGTAAHLRGAVGFGVSRHDLPYHAAIKDGQRSRTSLRASGFDSRSGWMTESAVLLRYARYDVPGLIEGDALGFAAEQALTLKSWRSVTVVARPRLELETADGSGSPSLLGGSLEAAWVPGEKLRAIAGFALDGASSARATGGRDFAGLAAPIAGLAWASPWGPTFSARFAPRLAVPWVAQAAVDAPYSVFGNPTTPERVLGDVRAAVRQEDRSGSIAEVSYRFRESRRAPSWYVLPQGLFTPAAVLEAGVHELGLSLRVVRWRPAVVSFEGRWREVETTGGAIANLPESEGRLDIAMPWKAFTFGASLDVIRSRPGSVAGPLVPGYGDLGLRAEWAPLPRLSILLAGSNLGAARVERWAGYPEPRRLVTLGARATF